MLKLKKPLAFVDLETTGTNINNDRICEISVVIINIDGTKSSKCRRLNPTIEIPKEATEIHGITNKDVENEPTFKQVSAGLSSMLEGCDLAGYNSDYFDLPILAKEFERAGVFFDFSKCTRIDVFRLYKELQPRKLSDCYKFFTGKDLVDAHSAEADNLTTAEIFDEMVSENFKDYESIEEFSRTDSVDVYNKVVMLDDVMHINFGKYRGKPLKWIKENDSNYINWLLNQPDVSASFIQCLNNC